MKDEVASAAKFLSDTVAKHNELSEEHGELFRTTLEMLMSQRFQNHWHPEKPLKGNAFRCLNINQEECCIDPLLKEAASESLIDDDDLTNSFPDGLALWIDPFDVSYRMGRAPICSIYRKTNPYKTQTVNRKPTTQPFRNTHNYRPTMKARTEVNSAARDSRLNSEAPVFTPKFNQDLSSIWTTNWNDNRTQQPRNAQHQQSNSNYYSYFQKDANQKKYNRFHWHREEKQQEQRRGFEFRRLAQEVY